MLKRVFFSMQCIMFAYVADLLACVFILGNSVIIYP